MISSHWVLIDPLLMLFTTLAAWAGWDLVDGRGRWRAIAFYMTLAIALWIKGLIGSVLIAAGLLMQAAFSRSVVPIRRVYPITGVLVMCAATAVLAFLIYLDAGQTAVREWLWVNHVQRFIAPQDTEHDQPFYYYLLAGGLFAARRPAQGPHRTRSLRSGGRHRPLGGYGSPRGSAKRPTAVCAMARYADAARPADIRYAYERLRDANFGPGRYFAIWRRTDGSVPSPR